jgi:hypothetical protein
MSYRLVKNQIGGFDIPLRNLINNNNNVYIISSHGLSSKEYMYIIPDNTYIISLTKSTENLCGLNGDQINACSNYNELIDLLNSKKNIDKRLNDLYIYGPGEIIALPEIINTGILEATDSTQFEQIYEDEVIGIDSSTDTEVITIIVDDINNRHLMNNGFYCSLNLDGNSSRYYVKSSKSNQTQKQLEEKINNYYNNLIKPIVKQSILKTEFTKRSIKQIVKNIIKNKLEIKFYDWSNNRCEIIKSKHMDSFMLSGLLKFTNSGIIGYDKKKLHGDYSVISTIYDKKTELRLFKQILKQRNHCLVEMSQIKMAHKIEYKDFKIAYIKLRKHFPSEYKFILFSLITNHYKCTLDEIIYKSSRHSSVKNIYIFNFCRGIEEKKIKNFDIDLYNNINQMSDENSIGGLGFAFNINTLKSLNNITNFLIKNLHDLGFDMSNYESELKKNNEINNLLNGQIIEFKTITEIVEHLNIYIYQEQDESSSDDELSDDDDDDDVSSSTEKDYGMYRIKEDYNTNTFESSSFNGELNIDDKEQLNNNMLKYIKISKDDTSGKIIIDINEILLGTILDIYDHINNRE